MSWAECGACGKKAWREKGKNPGLFTVGQEGPQELGITCRPWGAHEGCWAGRSRSALQSRKISLAAWSLRWWLLPWRRSDSQGQLGPH